MAAHGRAAAAEHTFDRRDDSSLHVLREGGRETVRVDQVRAQALGLKPHAVAVAACKAHHLGRQRRAVPRPRALVLWEEVCAVEHNGVRVDVRRCPVALDQTVRLSDGQAEAGAHVGKGLGRARARLRLQLLPVDRAAVEAGRSTGLEPSQWQAQLAE